MPSYKNFQRQYVKNSKKNSDLFSKPKEMVLVKDIDEERQENLIDWCTWYRRNIHRFVEHYMGVQLYFYQRIWIYYMATRDSFVAIAARGTGKTWLLAILAIAKAILYPHSEIVVVSSTKAQAGLLVEKCQDLQNSYPNIAREIYGITTNMNRWAVDFHNGSTIKVVASRDSSRGRRSTFTIYEEFRLIDKDIVDSVIRPFSYIRQVPYLKIPEYSNLGEEPKEVFISSAYLKGLWWFEETKKNIKAMLAGENKGFIAFDFRLSVKHHIKTVASIKNEISKMDEITAMMEYGNVPFGEGANSYFKLKQFTKARTVEKAFYPQRIETYNPKKNPYGIPRMDGEIRVVSSDVAQRAGRANDLSITSLIRLLPTQKGYFRELSYIESFSGVNSILQSLRLKQLYYDFEADYIVLDVAAGGGGLPMYDQLGQITKDDERGIEYPAMTIMQHNSLDANVYDELSRRTLGINAIPVVYPISGVAVLNSKIAVEMRDKLQKRLFGLLVDETRAEDYLIKSKQNEYMNNDDPTAKSYFMHPFVQTSLLVSEAIGLTMTMVSGNIKLVEVAGSRKDRYTSVAYGNYFASLLDAELLRDNNGLSDEEAILAVTMVM
jgi:hypothetical protein